MFKKLKQKWNVSWANFILIWITFACGGSLCGFLGKKIIALLNLEKGVLYWILYIILITILWPFCVLAISIVTWQFVFFKNYIGKLLKESPVNNLFDLYNYLGVINLRFTIALIISFKLAIKN